MAVAFVTDIEGMWDKLVDFAAGNPLLSLDVVTGALTVAPGARFVFGGDAVDRGPWGRRVVRTLLEAKRRQPEQVVLLAGNRDINKLRLPRELGGQPLSRTPAEVASGPRPELLRWIFANTMGARDAFEHRRRELAAERRAAAVEVGDEEVVDSFVADCRPGDDHAELVAASQLAYRVGPTLFVHGGITEDSLGLVPGRAPLRDVDEWVAALNGWYREQVGLFQAGAPDVGGQPAWWPLVAYQAPLPGTRGNPQSVVYGRTTDALQNPELPPPAVIAALTAQGVRRVVVGHTPIGDCPAPVRDDGFELLFADNSHARIAVASQVAIDGDQLTVRARSAIDGGKVVPIVYSLSTREDSPIGRRRSDSGHLVMGQVEGGDFLEFKYLEGFRTEQRMVSAQALAGVRLEPPHRGRGGVT